MYDLILAFITAFGLTFYAIPSIIHVAKKKNLVDEPDDRKAHKVSTPSLGGIGIFAGTIFSIVLWTPFKYFGDLQYILTAFVIMFLVGARDDIDPISPYKKFGAQIFAAGLLVFVANIRLTSMYGIFGITVLPPIASILLSLFTIILIINAFNLIDGINGLSASIGLIIALCFGTWFFLIDKMDLSIVAFALAGSIIAFLKYNFTPAKIFMGDTGSLIIGLVCAILTIQFIELHKVIGDSPFKFKATPAVAIGVLILPLFDTLRVFTIRIVNGRSPFSPDRNHIHHLLIDLDLSHMQATGTLVFVNLLFIYLAYSLQDIGSLYLLLVMLVIAILLSSVLALIVMRKKRKA